MSQCNAENLSVIIQGPFHRKLPNTLEYYMANFQKVELVLVIWENEKEQYLQQIKKYLHKVTVVFATDPGGQTSDFSEKLNVNRQLVSVQKGLEYVTRKYCVKTRSDIVVNLHKLMNQYQKYNRPSNYPSLKESILVINLTSNNPNTKLVRYFAFCDWLYLGLTEDLKNNLASDMYPEEYLHFNVRHNSSLRYNAEQWMLLRGLLGDKFESIFPESYAVNEDIKKLHSTILTTFIVLPIYKIGLKSYKYLSFQFALWNMYTFLEWKKVYYPRKSFLSIDFERFFYNLLKYMYKVKNCLR